LKSRAQKSDGSSTLAINVARDARYPMSVQLFPKICALIGYRVSRATLIALVCWSHEAKKMLKCRKEDVTRSRDRCEKSEPSRTCEEFGSRFWRESSPTPALRSLIGRPLGRRVAQAPSGINRDEVSTRRFPSRSRAFTKGKKQSEKK